MRFFISGIFLFSVSIAEQIALDAFAAQLRLDGWPKCEAPNLSECTADCASQNCGNFNVKIDENKTVLALHVFYNSLSALPTEIGLLTGVTYIELQFNSLTALPAQIGLLSKLEYLELQNNAIEELPSEIGNLVSLNNLNIRVNSLVALPSQIGRLSQLTYFFVDHNKMTAVPAELGSLTNLLLLHMYENHLADIPTSVSKLVKLTGLSLNHNSLTDLPSEIGKLEQIKYLDLQDNFLTALPQEFANLKNLMYMWGMSGLQRNFLNCSHMQQYLPTSLHSEFCSEQLTCTTQGCDSSIPVCKEENGSCLIQCGGDYYRNTDFCYPCSDSFMCEQCKGDGLCLVCQPEQEIDSGECRAICPEDSYRAGGECFSCSDIVASSTPCQECSGDGHCSACLPGFGLIVSECMACSGNSYSADGVACLPGPENCIECVHTESFCLRCDLGFELAENGTCIPCTGGTYGDDGLTCKKIENCEKATEHNKEEYCAQCIAGYGVIEGGCEACQGNAYSDDGKGCKQGPFRCLLSDHTMAYCKQCEAGYKVSSTGECVVCENGKFSPSGTICQDSTHVDGCAVYYTDKDWCRSCSGGASVTHENQCRLCVDGEIARESECIVCEHGTYSAIGKTGCTNDCSEFTDYPTTCLASGFCKVSLGKCVELSDKSSQTLSIVLVVVFVLIAIAVFVGWRMYKRSGRALRKYGELDGQLVDGIEDIEFDTCSLDVRVGPQELRFDGQRAAAGVELCEAFEIDNNSLTDVIYTLTVKEENGCTITIDTLSDTLKPGKRTDVFVKALKEVNEEATGLIQVTVHSKRDKHDGKHINITVAMRGL